MANVFDYLEWRGDILFEHSPFNEVDGAVLAMLAYVPFDTVLGQRAFLPEPIGSVAEKMLLRRSAGRVSLTENAFRLLTALVSCPRFNALELMYYVNVFNPASQNQFAAITVRLAKDRYFVAYRGTDNTLVGWKEDLNMSFSCPVPAQGEAVRYLDSLGKKLGIMPENENEKTSVFLFPSSNCRLIVGGHSKGGNLAVYASAYCAEAVRERIDSIYNFDGPGFTEKVLSSEGYKAVCERVKTFVPQSSIVGMLLGHEEKYTIVRSTNSSIWQHDTYSWEIERDRFLRLESVTNGSKFMDYTLKNWMTSLPPERRERFCDAVYTVLSDTKAFTLKELSQNKIETMRRAYSSIKNLDEQSRKDLTYTMKMFFKSAKVGMIKMLEDKPETQS